jgi:4-amino-4-deoxy-L-arabinose transferase-like glycosyltransferase
MILSLPGLGGPGKQASSSGMVTSLPYADRAHERLAAMPEGSLGGVRLIWLLLLAAVVLLPGLGSSARLTYHEALVAQGAREMLASGNWAYPTLGGLPWLEKPPLPWWLVAVLGRWTGMVDETVARLPSTLAAMGVIAGTAVLAARHYGAQVGLVAGAVQATTAWTVIRGRLAEADMLLACLITWALVAFDQLLSQSGDKVGIDITLRWRCWHWAFLVCLGTSALVKGIGFGTVLILIVIGGVLIWQRDGTALRRLWLPAGWALAVALAVAWPLFMVAQHGQRAVSLWTMHVWARLIQQEGPGPFAGESWWEYIAGLLGQGLPWTPFALAGAGSSLRRALGGNFTSGGLAVSPALVRVLAGDRLLGVWAVLPLILLALAPVKNAHYAISVQVPWSIWAALALARLGTHLRMEGYSRHRLRIALGVGFMALALTYGLGLWLFASSFNRRGVEWAFYEAASRKVPIGMRLALFYDDWDRKPYITPFGSIPHDLAVRLFYLGRSACWHAGPTLGWPNDHILGRCSTSPLTVVGPQLTTSTQDDSFAVIGRDRDLPLLRQFGHVEAICRGPTVRPDRTYVLFYVTPLADAVRFAGRSRIQPVRPHVSE